MPFTWKSLRRLLRAPVSASIGASTDTSSASSPPAQPRSDSQVSTQSSRDVSELHSKVSRLETAFADANARTVELAGKLREADLKPDAASLFETLKQDVDSLRRNAEANASRLNLLAERLAMLEAKVESEAAELTAIEAKQRTFEERLTDAQARARDAESAALSSQQTFRALRQDLEARDARRDREMNGRLAGLYIIGFVALTAALATLVIFLMQGRGR